MKKDILFYLSLSDTNSDLNTLIDSKIYKPKEESNEEIKLYLSQSDTSSDLDNFDNFFITRRKLKSAKEESTDDSPLSDINDNTEISNINETINGTDTSSDRIKYDIGTNIKPTKYTAYNIYTVNNKIWEEYLKLYEKQKLGFLSTFSDYAVRTDDIILIYLKKPSKSVFVGLAQADTNQCKNKDNIKIFKDNNLNMYLIKLRALMIFDTPVDTRVIYDVLKNELHDIKSLRSFQLRYLNQYDAITKLPPRIGGDQLVIVLKNMWLQMKPAEIKDDDSEGYDKDIFIKENSESDNNTTDSEFDYNFESDDNSASNSEEDIIIEEIEECTEGGMIPVIFLPCDTFITDWEALEDLSDKQEYFRIHYMECRHCEKTDNNNISLDTMISIDNNDVVVCLVTVTEIINADIDLSLPYYYNLKRCPIDEDYIEDLPEDKKGYVRIIEIKNGHEEYDDCFLILWFRKS